MAGNQLDIAKLRECLSYDPETGAFTWLKSRGGRLAGTPAGHIKDFGGQRQYLMIRFNDRLLMAHRLAYALMTGELAPRMLDHRNCNSLDNRWSNLRPATPRQNAQNTRKRSDNRSGEKGVSWCGFTGKWVARIRTPDGPYRNLGRFITVKAAKEAYDSASRKYFGEFARAA